MTARELVESLAALPGVRSVATETRGIERSALVNGIEVAQAAEANERQLRAAWRRRTSGGATPLLLVADDPESGGVVLALGPVTHEGPVRIVSADALGDVLRRASTLSALQAVRDVAEQLEHLDRTGVAGLTVKGLGTEHLFRERLRQTADWTALGVLAETVTGSWRDALRAAGYELEELARGYLARHEGAPVAVVHPVADVSAFAKLDSEGRPPEGLLLEACRTTNAPYGILAAGTRLRLFEAAPESGSAIARYLELDTAALAEEDRPLLGLLTPPYLAGGGFGRLMAEARAYGVGLRKRLDTAIRELVLPPLGRELGRWAAASGRDVADDAVRRDLEAAALTFVFRALFLLYAESRGYLPMARDAYARGSLTQVVRDAWEQRGSFDERSTKFWDRAQTLVRAMRSGDEALGVPAYNGDLFAPEGFDGSATLDAVSLPDSALGPALVALGIEADSGDGYDFSQLDVGHLGHIYEGLLSLRLSLADRPYRYDGRRERYVPADDEAEYAAGELLWLTMLPEPGDLEEMLRLETLVRAKIRAAGVYGMEVEVIDGIESDLRQYAERLAGGDIELLADEDDGLSGAFLGELLRAKLLRAQLEGELARIEGLPWGIGAGFRQTAGGRSRGAPGVFFATRTRPLDGAPSGYRYWRYVEADGDVLDADLEILRRIDPEGGEPADIDGVDLEGAWAVASASIVEEHSRRADPRVAQDAIGPAQRFALDLLRDPTVILPEGAERAAEALAVECSTAVRRELNGIASEMREERISGNEAARRIVELVDRLGLQPVRIDDVPREIDEDDLGVVCWMAVLGADG